MSGYIIHFDNETELTHYGIKGMKWDIRKKKYRTKEGVYAPKEYYDELKSNSYKFNDPKHNKMIDKYDLQNHAHKSAKSLNRTPGLRKKQQSFERKALKNQSIKVEKQLTKALDSGKKMDKTYKVGRQEIHFNQDSKGSTASTISGTAKISHERVAKKVIDKAYNKHIKNVENKRPINRGKNIIKSLFNKLKKLF